MKRAIFVVAALIALVVLAGCAAPEQTAKITNAGFVPAQVTVRTGGSVTWTNTDKNQHTVTFGANDSGALKSGETYTQVMEKAGTYEYYCRYHPSERGRVIVR